MNEKPPVRKITTTTTTNIQKPPGGSLKQVPSLRVFVKSTSD